ncbi:MAG TPA: threonine synthase [Phototrophicaceae bacterium]|nr:threonine synthase [Phototrophicaceae bacterium]
MSGSPKQIILECTYCGTSTSLDKFPGACPACGEVIVEARYDLDDIIVEDWLTNILHRPKHLWRYHEVLPVYDTANIVSLGEGATPLIRAETLGASLGLKHLYIKDERQGPTGSFKDRQATVAISALKEMGVTEVVVASTGNVAIAYAAYCARAGIKLWAFFPRLTPNEKMREAALYGAEIIKTTGNYDQTKELAAQFAKSKGIFLDKGIKSVAAIEAMKTMAYEIGDQLAADLGGGTPWRAPDWFLQGVSGGMGPIGVGKGFREMHHFGLINKMPAFGIIQSTGCAPMVEAFDRGQRVATPVEDPTTIIATLATGNPGRAYELLYDYTQEYGGYFISASDEEAFNAIRILARNEGLSVEPATGVTFAGLFNMVRRGVIRPDDVVVVNCSGHTMPVEKDILGEAWQKQVDLANASKSPTLPMETRKTLVLALDKVVEPEQSGKTKRVVIIEDNEAAARLMGRILQSRTDTEVRIAHNGGAGMLLIRSWRPDIVITDLMMPEVDGFMVIDMMKGDADLKDIPIVVVTAKDLTARERDILDNQVDLLLQKGSFFDEGFVENIVSRL